MRGQGTSSYAGGRLLVLFAMALSALLVVPAIASAEYLHRDDVHRFDERKWHVEQPRRVAVEQSTGNAFVVEQRTGRVLVFTPDGLGATNLTEFGAGILEAPYGIAIDQSGGQTRIYVSDRGMRTCEEEERDEEVELEKKEEKEKEEEISPPEPGEPVACDAPGADSQPYGGRIVRFLSDEQPTPSFSVDATYSSPTEGTEAGQVENFGSPLALAPNGDLWVADPGADVVKRFDASGTHVAGSNIDGSGSPEGAFTGLTDIAANSAGDLYIVDATGSGELARQEVTSRVQRFGPDGSYKATLGPLGPNSRSAIVAVNPADDRVLVSGDQDAISHGDAAPRFHLFDSSNAYLEEVVGSFEAHQGASFRGAAFFPDMRNRFYFVGGKNWYFYNEIGAWAESAGFANVHVLSEALPPTINVDPPSGVTSSSATIAGAINPNGIPTEWQIEYRRAGADEWQDTGLRFVGDGNSALPVTEALENLLPAQEYEARLRAVSADGESESSVVTFTTAVGAPRVVGQSADAGTHSATLRGRIAPGGAETTYRFEYGQTDSYGQSTPETTVPAAGGGVNVAAQIDGLAPGTTYHFRLVVENDVGDGAGADRTFSTLTSEVDACPNAEYRTGPEARLSDCRAYELVTPSDSEADIRVGGGPSTPDGSVVCFNTEDPLAGSDPNGIKTADDGFCARRDADGWETDWVTGPTPIKRYAAMGGNVYFLSPDGKRAVFGSDEFIFRPDFLHTSPTNGTTQMRSYMWEDGQTRELSPPPTPLVIPGLGEFFFPENTFSYKRPLAVSEDLTRGIFQSTNNLIPEDTNFALDVYEWGPEGLRVVSAADDSTVAAGGAPPLHDARQLSGTGIVSADGSRIFFHHTGAPLDGDAAPSEAPEALQSVYMREGDEVTLVSPRDAAVADEEFRFAAASSDGETVYLESTQPMDPANPHLGSIGAELYVYDVSTGSFELFASPPGGGEILGISKDGSSVVYRSLGSFQAFLVRGGETTLLGTLAAKERGFSQNDAAETAFRLGSFRHDQRALRFTPDGSAFVFVSAGEFAGATGGVAQVYRWSEEDGLQNISDGGASPPTRDASIGAYSTTTPGSTREEFLHEHRFKALEGRVLSDDGSRVFFETPEALVARDQNGVIDVYEWHDGRVDLVSTGTGRGKALYHDNSADGKTVFFTTFDRLDPERDRNSNRDVYVAQSGGGFPALPAEPSCAGEACQPERPAPSAGGAGSGAVGEGNVAPAPKIAALGKKQLKRLAKTGRTTVKVVVGEPGRVTALLKGKISGRNTTVARAARTASKAGTVSLPLKLSKKALAQLRKRGTLRLTLEVTHSRSDQAARKAVMLRD